MNPYIRFFFLGVLSYFGGIFGNALTINAFSTLLGFGSCFSYVFIRSFPIFAIYFLLMIITLYVSMPVFKKLYYLFFLAIAWYIHSVSAYLIYSFLNLFITIPNIINLAMLLIIGTGLLIQGIYSESHTIYEKINLKCPKLKGNVKFAHLSDMHLGVMYGREFVQKLVTMIIKQNVDFVCITGDIVDGNIRMTRDMIEPFEQLKCPIYFVSGNHEEYTWKKEALQIIDSTYIQRIVNKIINYDNKLNIIGLDYVKKTEVALEQLKQLLGNKMFENSQDERPYILLNHVPILNAKELKDFDIFLFLCGHYHGGHFFPFTLLQLFRNRFIFEGLYNYENKFYVYCNSGQATSGPCVRSLSKSQIGIITLEGTSI